MTTSAEHLDLPEAQRIAELEAEVRRLQGMVKRQPSPSKKSGSRGRTFAAVVLITVASLLAPLSIASVWARGEVTDTDRYVATMAPLASDSAVQQAVSNRIRAELYAYLDTLDLPAELVGAISEGADLTEAQTNALNALVGPLQSGVRGYVDDAINEVVQSPQFSNAWTEINTVSHDQVTALLSGDSNTALELQGNDVVLDLNGVVTEVKARLVDQGFTIAENIPAVNAQIVVFQGQNLSTIQSAYAALNSLGFWLPLVAVVLALIGVFLANNSRRALIGFGVGLTVAMAVSAVSLAAFRAGYLRALPDSVDAAATAFFDTISYFLRQALWAGAAAGVVLILAGVLSGQSAFAGAVRRPAIASAEAVQGWLASFGATMDGARAWVSSQATGLRIAAALLAIAFVMAQQYKTPALILWTTVGLLVALFVIQVFASGQPEDTRVAATDDTAAADTRVAVS